MTLQSERQKHVSSSRDLICSYLDHHAAGAGHSLVKDASPHSLIWCGKSVKVLSARLQS